MSEDEKKYDAFKDPEDYKEKLTRALNNIRNDRDKMELVLLDAMDYLRKSKDNHRIVGSTVAKYFEILQKSNEQLIKILQMEAKNRVVKDDEEFEFDSDELYEEMKKEDVR